MAKIDTRCVHAGYQPGKGEPRQVPIIQSTTFKYETSDQMGKLFDLEESGYFYTRLQNPTVDATAAQIIALRICLPAVAPTYTPSHMNAKALTIGIQFNHPKYCFDASNTSPSLVIIAMNAWPHTAYSSVNATPTPILHRNAPR